MTSMRGSVSSSVTSTASNQLSRVDRKRRDNINDRIQQLLTMIPNEFFQDYYKNSSGMDSEYGSGDTPSSATTPKPGTSAAKIKGTGTRDGKPNKGQILTQAVEYIMSLQNEIDLKNREEVELILKVQDLSKITGTIVNDINLENTSAEMALAKIGVGSLAGEIAQNNEQGQLDSQTALPANSQYANSKISNFEYGGYSEYGDGI